MNWHIYLTNQAEKQLKKMPWYELQRIEKTIDSMVLNPFFGDIAKLAGQENKWRRRVGNYRIFYELHFEKKSMYIFNIQRRTSSIY